MNTSSQSCRLVVVCLLCLLVTPLGADQPNGGQAGTQENADTRSKALNWIDEYRNVQVLFHDEDLTKLREKLASDTAEQVEQWWQETEPIRAALQSPQWQQTRQWFREFLRVQAIFSDKEIEKLRDDAETAVRKGKPEDLKQILDRIERYRANLVRGAADDRELRQQKLQVLNAYRQRDFSRRTQENRAATFSSSGARSPRRYRDFERYTGPLVDSMDVARWAIFRGLWRN